MWIICDIPRTASSILVEIELARLDGLYGSTVDPVLDSLCHQLFALSLRISSAMSKIRPALWAIPSAV